MNRMQKIFLEAVIVGFGFGLIIGFLLGKAQAADLDLPPIIKYGINPPKYQPELCLQDGKNGFPGQTLKADKGCKSGLRWVYQE